MAACPSCGKENEAGARFCSACGFPLAADAPPREVRKTVTVLFCDVTGSTALGERLDPEATRKLMTRYFETARAILERHGASVEKFIGDAVIAVFGIPQVHEDDALRAARAALELRDSVADLQLRIGVNTGEVVAGSGETLVTGDAVNVAARLEQAASPGEVLLGERTYRLLREAVRADAVEPIEAKGKSERLQAYRLTNVDEDAALYARRLDSPLVGRVNELRQLEQAFDRAELERSCGLITVIGTPGIGKSRLSHEFVRCVANQALVVRGHCLSYGEGITYWPLLEILRDLGEPGDIVALLEGTPNAREMVNDVFTGIGLAEGSLRPEETNRAVRRLFEALASRRPLVVVLDDIHWAEQTFLDLLDHVVDLSREAPIALLCLARPELLDERPGWGSGKHNATTLLLDPLSDHEAETLVANLAGENVDDAVRARVSAAADGNPLFVEQMLAMWSDDASGDELPVPPTIQALLAARLDRLEPAERVLVESASVVGKEFWLRAVIELGADPAALPALARKELISPYQSTVFKNDDAYRFRHDLIRDAAYDAIPKETRAHLHERFADWVAQQLSEFDEIVGYHLEQAHRYHFELGEEAPELAERAGRMLGAAGMRAEERADFPAATNLLTRAVELLSSEDERRAELLVHLGWAHHDAGRLDQADAYFAEAVERANSEPAIAARANVGRLAAGIWSADELSARLVGIEQELAKLKELDDPTALAEAYREAAKIQGHLGRTEQGDRLFEKAIATARQSGSGRIVADVILWQFAMQCWGYLPAGDGLRHANELLDQGVAGMAKAFALVVRGRYRGLQGDVEAGRADIEAGRALIREFGADFYVAGSGQEHGQFEFDAGNWAAAEVVLRDAADRYAAMGGESLSSDAASLLALALLEQGRVDEADEQARLSERNSAVDDVSVQMEWRTVCARVAARRGDYVQGEALAREAVARAERTDFLEFNGYAFLALAEVLQLAGREEEARPWLEKGLRSFERKGSVFWTARARERLRELTGEPLAELD
jgi:class 3 adenylate cyclase/tetratricopeptide (TPR) repeat protein